MINYGPHIDECIARCASGEATENDWNQLANWCDLSLENAKYADQTMVALAWSEKKNNPSFDSQSAWQKVEPQLKTTHDRSLWMRLSGVAATALLLFLVFRPRAIEKTQVLSAQDVVKEKLPDGAEVVVNSQSTLTTEYNKRRGEMYVTLTGEAFFDLNKKESDVFEVTAGELKIRDIGTSFHVSARSNNDSILISVFDGLVEARSENGISKTLRAGETAVYLQSQDRFISLDESETENVSAYKDRKFTFKNTPLRRVVRQLNNVYKEQLFLEEENLGNCRITVSFDNESIDAIASILAETLELQSKGIDGGILLSGAGCE